MSKRGHSGLVESRSKYGAKATVVDNIRFASQKEARRYGELRLLEKAGEIAHLETQPIFKLFVSDLSVGTRLKRVVANVGKCKRDPVQHEHIGTYVADFRYQERILNGSENARWRVVVEDVKGFKTPLYRWKKKHVEAQYGITVMEI